MTNNLPRDNQRSVDALGLGQRLDNYLLRILKRPPKPWVYRLIRTGQVRVNGARAAPDYRLQAADIIRLPPAAAVATPSAPPRPMHLPPDAVLYEDDQLLALDKPVNVPVHGGTRASGGLIDHIRAQYNNDTQSCELAHRLDRATSGVLLIAKTPTALRALHRQFLRHEVEKTYHALITGRIDAASITTPLQFIKQGDTRLARVVSAEEKHKLARTDIAPVSWHEGVSLITAKPITGRIHQIRCQLRHIDHPILGDRKYGDFRHNRLLERAGFRRLFLHASTIAFTHPTTHSLIEISAPLPAIFTSVCQWQQKGGGKMRDDERLRPTPIDNA